MANRHYQVRIVKEIKSDGTLVTFDELGGLPEQRGQKTQKSSLKWEEIVRQAVRHNYPLPAGAMGIVIVEFKAGGPRVATGRKVRPYVGPNTRKVNTTHWCLFVDRDEKQFEITAGHKIRLDPS